MRRILTLCALLLGAATLAWSQDYPGETPEPGKTYHLWNIGQHRFLASDGGLLTMGEADMTVTVEADEGEAAVRLATPEGLLSSSLFDSPRADGKGDNRLWLPIAANDSMQSYNLACCYSEGSDPYLLFSAVLGQLVMEPEQPLAYEDGLWRFVSPAVVTGISSVADGERGHVPSTDATIYNLQGQPMGSRSLDALPRGVYIQGGKKIVKK